MGGAAAKTYMGWWGAMGGPTQRVRKKQPNEIDNSCYR